LAGRCKQCKLTELQLAPVSVTFRGTEDKWWSNDRYLYEENWELHVLVTSSWKVK